MVTKRFTIRVLAGLTLLSGAFAGRAAAQPRAEEILARKPIQPGVQVTTPTGSELTGCKAEQMAWPKPATGPAPTGVVVRDGQGRLVRQFVDTTGRNNPNIFSYYLNGVEAYREIDSDGDGKPNQYRWLGANGGKWGEDKNADGIVDVWYVLSAEELSQELFQVMITKDPRRLAPLLASAEDLKAAGLPEAEAAKIAQRAGQAPKRLGDTAEALKMTSNARWIHLEIGIPQTTPGDAVGSPSDVVVHKNATVLFEVEKGNGERGAAAFQTGEMVQVGRTWRIVDGPLPGHAPIGGEAVQPGTGPVPDSIRDLVKKLIEIQPPAEATPEATIKYHTARAAVLEEIVAKTQGPEQEPWLKQVVDAYAVAAESKDEKSMTRLKQWQESIVKGAPKSDAASYASFRLLSAEYAMKLTGSIDNADVMKTQTWWREQLEEFLKKFGGSDDAPEATLRLAVAYEFAGKDGEPQAKKWYEELAKNHPDHPYAGKAKGAVKRLTSEGQPFQLAGPSLGNGQQFDVAQLNGKPVIVYFWASWGRNTAGDLKQLVDLAKLHKEKGLEIVTVSLDVDPSHAVKAINEAQVPGTHLHAAGGLDASPLAVSYGIQMVPHVFLIGKDGKVMNRNAQMGPVLKDEVEKLVK